MMEMLPKLRGLYKCLILEPWRLDAPDGSKKLQSQIFKSVQKSCDWSVTKHANFRISKVSGANDEKDILGVLRNVA
jgi:hypothetical protein